MRAAGRLKDDGARRYAARVSVHSGATSLASVSLDHVARSRPASESPASRPSPGPFSLLPRNSDRYRYRYRRLLVGLPGWLRAPGAAVADEDELAHHPSLPEEFLGLSRLGQGEAPGDERLDLLLLKEVEQGAQISSAECRFQPFEPLDAVEDHSFPAGRSQLPAMYSPRMAMGPKRFRPPERPEASRPARREPVRP
jgi:hypothetical protein